MKVQLTRFIQTDPYLTSEATTQMTTPPLYQI